MKNIVLSSDDVLLIDGLRQSASSDRHVANLLDALLSGVEAKLIDMPDAIGDGGISVTMHCALIAACFAREDYAIRAEFAPDNVCPIKQKSIAPENFKGFSYDAL